MRSTRIHTLQADLTLPAAHSPSPGMSAPLSSPPISKDVKEVIDAMQTTTANTPLQERLFIEGGKPLKGEVTTSGAKNSVLKLMAAALLSPHPVRISNVPRLSDVAVMQDVLEYLGAKVETQQDANGTDAVLIDCAAIHSCHAPYELVSKMRASFVVLGSLLGRFGEAKVSLPGGCTIGKRGVDLHIKGLTALGAEIQLNHGYVEAKAAKLSGATIVLDTPSVGATENILLAAVLAEGTTVLSNAAQEPEIVDLANFLNAMGADIHGAGNNEIVIHGVSPKDLHAADYAVMPDRIEAATYIMAAIGTGGSVVVKQVPLRGLDAVLGKLAEMGAEIQMLSRSSVKIKSHKARLQPVSLITQPFPGFPTDLQAPLMTLATVAEGSSVITETLYENRFKQVGELSRMGAQIEVQGNVAIVQGIERLAGAPIKAHDLRAGAAMLIAGLMADGKTEIFDLHHLDRGYERLVEKCQGLGANIQRI
ncbi:MAG: UDP-N-acetylglucosamine 1-carboxyvinyltransferase [Vampirovibrionales bacterium]|nr:UDP-N-acetylglucosamine 1-carboxyvinyltransferase [Vampirovibrionales bacterium]